MIVERFRSNMNQKESDSVVMNLTKKPYPFEVVWKCMQDLMVVNLDKQMSNVMYYREE